MPKDKNLFALILAGGTGTRFWPLSRQAHPKQFLTFLGRKSLLQLTLERILPMVEPSQIYVVTLMRYRKVIRPLIKDYKIPSSNLLFEPDGKNTAPPIAWAAARMMRVNPNAMMVVLPSDHIILNKYAFLKTIRLAVNLAWENNLVTLGIVPTRPETGYGYLKTMCKRFNGRVIWKVVQFTEKPSLTKAKRYFQSRNYYWNSGMFIWKAAVILEEYNKYQPVIHRLMKGNTSQQGINRVWSRLSSISVDYAILEKSQRVVTVPAENIGWTDLGSWQAYFETLPKDRNQNILKGDVIVLDCSNTFVYGSCKLISIIGLEDITVVDTPDALLVCRTSESQKVKELVSLLEKGKHKSFL